MDGCFFAFSGAAAIWLAYLLVRDGVREGWPSLLLLVFWVFFTYLVLPRLHRILTEIYVPGYFIGRDPHQRRAARRPGQPGPARRRGPGAPCPEAAGWIRADDLDFGAGRRIALSVAGRRSYPAAPVSPLHLFDRQQDFAYQQEVEGNPSRRHHVRFWRCPEGWLLPGGFAADWLAAATFDHGEERRLLLPGARHRHPEHGPGDPALGVPQLGLVGEVTGEAHAGLGHGAVPPEGLAGRSALPLEPGDGGHRGMPKGHQGQATKPTKSADARRSPSRWSAQELGWLVGCLRLGVGHAGTVRPIPPPWAWRENEAPTTRAARSSAQAASRCAWGAYRSPGRA